MLSQKSIQLIAKLTKTDIAAIQNALKDEKEVDLAIPENLNSFTEDELNTRDNNMKETGKKDGERIGEEKGKELAVKAIKNKLSLTDPSKDPEHIAGVIQGQLKGDNALKEQVQLLQTSISQKDKEISEYKTKAEAALFDAELLSLLPANKSTALENAEHLQILKANLEFTAEGVKYKGTLLRDTQTQSPLDKKAAIEHFYGQRKGLLSEESGSGGDDTGAKGRGKPGSNNPPVDGFKTLKEVRQAWAKQNPSENFGSENSQVFLESVLKKNPDLLMEDDGKD